MDLPWSLETPHAKALGTCWGPVSQVETVRVVSPAAWWPCPVMALGSRSGS